MTKIIFRLLILLIALTWIPSAMAEQTINDCPIPDDMKVVAPDKNEISEKLALFSGIWQGNWGAQSVLFIVEKMQKDEAVVILSQAGRKKKGLGGSIDPKYVRKKCPIEMGADGNYQITMVMNRVTNRLIQTKDPNSIRVVREGLGGSKASDEMKDSLFRRKEMK